LCDNIVLQLRKGDTLKTHIQIDVEVKKELEALRDKHELASLSAVINKLLKQVNYRLKG